MFIIFRPAWVDRKGISHRCMTISGKKAEEIAKYHRNPPGDLSEEQLDMLKCIHKIYPGLDRDSHTEQLEKISDKLTHEGILQGMNEALPRNDR